MDAVLFSFKVITGILQFPGHRWATLLRYMWWPCVVSMLITLMCAPVLAAGMYACTRMPSGGKVVLLLSCLVCMATLAASTFPLAGAQASLVRLIALGEERSGLLHFRTDGPAVRVFITGLLLSLPFLVIYAGLCYFSLVSGRTISSLPESVFEILVIFLQDRTLPAATDVSIDLSVHFSMIEPFFIFLLLPGASMTIAMLFVYPLFPFVMLPAVAAAENRISIRHIFRMASGKFLSIPFLYGCASIPGVAVYFMKDFFLPEGPDLFSGNFLLFSRIATLAFLALIAASLPGIVTAVIYRKLAERDMKGVRAEIQA